jgi:hypothetical protein
MNGLTELLQSRRAWLLLIGVVVSLATYFAAKYGGESVAADVRFVIVTVDGLVLYLITMFTIDGYHGAKLTHAERLAEFRVESLRLEMQLAAKRP